MKNQGPRCLEQCHYHYHRAALQKVEHSNTSDFSPRRSLLLLSGADSDGFNPLLAAAPGVTGL